MSKLIKKVSITVVSIATVLSLSGAAGLVPTVNAAALTSAQVSAIISLLQSFGADATTIANVQASLTGSPAVATTGTSSISVPASLLSSSDLTVGSKGAAVMDLQKFLNANGYTIAASGAGSLGNESTYFGNATKAALAKWQAAMGITPASGYFGKVSRAKLSAMAAAATSGSGTTTTTGTTVTVPSGSGLSVSVASSNPAAGNFPAGASQIPFLTLNFTAGANDVTVTAMNVYRAGLSSDNDINNVYLMDGSKVAATNIGLANGKANFSVSSGIFTVKAGTTKVITVAADVSDSSTASHTFAFNINSAADITAGSATVSGNFPLLGNVMQAVSVSNPALATLQLNNIAVGTQVNAGTTNFLAGEFSLQANNSAVSVKSIKLTETGTINAASDLANIKLMNGSIQVGATMPALNADGTVVFDLSSNPLQIPSGQTINLMVYADVIGGVSRYFQFTIQRSYDVVATDMSYNVGATLSATAGFPLNGGDNAKINVSAGTLTVSKDANSPANYIVPGSTNQTLASFDFTAAGEAVRITELHYKLSGYSYSGSGADNTVWNNLKLVDDQGTQIGSIITSSDGKSNSYTVDYTSANYIIPAGQTRVLSIKADILSGYTNSIEGDLISGRGQGYTSLASVEFGAQNGNLLSANAASFSASVNNAVGNIITVSGASSVKVGSFSLSAGPAEGVNVVSVTLTTGDAVANKYQNLKVMNGSAQLGYTQPTLTNSSQYTFSVSSPIAIAAGGSAIIDVYADTISGATSTVATVVTLTGASATGALSNATKSLSGSTTGQPVTINESGSLTVALSPDSPISQQVAMGLSGVKLGSFKLSADNNEGIKLTNVQVYATSTALANIKDIKLMNGTTQIGSTISGLSGLTGYITFTIPTGSVVIPQNGNITLSVVADINGINNAVSGGTITVGLGNVLYSGSASNSSKNTSTLVDSGATFTIYKGIMGAVSSTSGNAIGTADNNGTLIGKVTFSDSSPSATQDLILKTATVKLSVFNATSTYATPMVSVYDQFNNLLGTSTVAVDGTATAIVLTDTAHATITAGSSKDLSFYLVAPTSADKVTSTNPISANFSLSAFTSDDGDIHSIANNPAITSMPAWSNITLVP